MMRSAVLDGNEAAAPRPFALRLLLRRLAAAFEVPPPVSTGLSGNDLLRAYAAFSNAQAELLLSGRGDPDAVRRDRGEGAARRLPGHCPRGGQAWSRS
jgi:hypothetical protein